MLGKVTQFGVKIWISGNFNTKKTQGGGGTICFRPVGIGLKIVERL